MKQRVKVIFAATYGNLTEIERSLLLTECFPLLLQLLLFAPKLLFLIPDRIFPLPDSLFPASYITFPTTECKGVDKARPLNTAVNCIVDDFLSHSGRRTSELRVSTAAINTGTCFGCLPECLLSLLS